MMGWLKQKGFSHFDGLLLGIMGVLIGKGVNFLFVIAGTIVLSYLFAWWSKK